MVTYQNLLDAAVRLVCESGTSGENADYAARAPYLLATFCNRHDRLDRDWRKAHDKEDGTYLPTVSVTLTDTFPFCDEFIDAAEYYLASMLVVDENEKLSEKFFDLYSDAVCSIQATLPAEQKQIRNFYPDLF